MLFVTTENIAYSEPKVCTEIPDGIDIVRPKGVYCAPLATKPEKMQYGSCTVLAWKGMTQEEKQWQNTLGFILKIQAFPMRELSKDEEKLVREYQ